MTRADRFERRLPELLAELAEPRTPDYFDDFLQRTANTSQRPAWSLLERWLPMVDFARQPVLGPRMPWRIVGLGFVLLALLIAMIAAVVVGTHRDPPAPFGLAHNGLVAYAKDGNIYTVDPVTSASTALVTGPETDRDPHWSRDGARLVFLRNTQLGAGSSQLYVVGADGANLTLLTPDPLNILGMHGFSPDGSQVLLTILESGMTRIAVADTDGSALTILDSGGLSVVATDPGPSWRPPDGAEILFANGEASLHAVNLATGAIRAVLPPTAGHSRGAPRWSPDGSRLAYVDWDPSANVLTAQIHIVNADGNGDRPLRLPAGAVWQAIRSWSNDGTRLLAIRGYTGGFDQTVAVALPIDGRGSGVEIDYPGVIQAGCCTEWEWAPDDTLILGTPTDAAGRALAQVLLDPRTGTSRTVAWSSSSQPTWQRLGD